MNDAPMGAELPEAPQLKDLAKPVEAPPTPVSVETPPAPASPADARKALEEIAAGPTQEAARATPAEQAAPVKPAIKEAPEKKAELGPDKEKVNVLLTQGAQLLLDAGDPRVAIAAVARSAAATPLGTELRRDVLTMIAETKGETFASIKKDIEALNLPKTDPARSEFAKFLEDYSSKNPDKAISPTVIEAIRTKKQDAAAAITHVLQTDTGLAASLWTEMKGEGTQAIPNVATADGLLTAAGLDATPENAEKAQKLYEPKGPHPVAKLWEELKTDVPSMLITSGMIFMLVSQLIMPEGSGGGH